MTISPEINYADIELLIEKLSLQTRELQAIGAAMGNTTLVLFVPNGKRFEVEERFHGYLTYKFGFDPTPMPWREFKYLGNAGKMSVFEFPHVQLRVALTDDEVLQ